MSRATGAPPASAEEAPGRPLPPEAPAEGSTQPSELVRLGSAGPAISVLRGRCQWPPGDGPLVTAVSGGPDSLALLVLAVATNRPVTAIHVDHGLRAGSQNEAGAVREVADRLGASFESRSVRVAPGPNLEARARQARYRALPAGVLTGHTADDQAETVLLNLLRGAGLDGLSGMRVHPRVGRPLLAIRRSETAALCSAAGLSPCRDPANDDEVHRRNQVRHRLLPLLAEIAQRDLVPVLCRQAELLGDDADLLDELARTIDPSDARALRAAPLPLARRAVRRWLRPSSGAEQHPPSAAEVARVLDVASGVAVACELSGGRRVQRSGGRLSIRPR